MPHPAIAHCTHHFRNIVANSAGGPTCRACGLAPTEAEQELEALVSWQRAQSLARPPKSRASGR